MKERLRKDGKEINAEKKSFDTRSSLQRNSLMEKKVVKQRATTSKLDEETIETRKELQH